MKAYSDYTDEELYLAFLQIFPPLKFTELFHSLATRFKAKCEEVETERLRLAACGVAAMQNTESTIKDRLIPDNPHYSASYGDVCRAVDREMALRSELEQTKVARLLSYDRQIEFLKEELAKVREKLPSDEEITKMQEREASIACAEIEQSANDDIAKRICDENESLKVENERLTNWVNDMIGGKP